MYKIYVMYGNKIMQYILFFLLLFMTGCSLKKADVDYDPSFETGKLKTFAVMHKDGSANVSLNQERIFESIVNEMESKAYIRMPKKNADFYITFESAVKVELYPNTNFGFGIGTYSRGRGISVGSAYDIIDEKETLSINMIDSKTKKIFWNSSYVYNTYESKSPKERIEYINKIVANMLSEFPAALIKTTK